MLEIDVGLPDDWFVWARPAPGSRAVVQVEFCRGRRRAVARFDLGRVALLDAAPLPVTHAQLRKIAAAITAEVK